MSASRKLRAVAVSTAVFVALLIAPGLSGAASSGDEQLDRPYGIGTDSAGNVYVADTSNHRVQKFTADGAFILSWGGEGMAPGELSLPSDIDIGPADSVYVSDAGNHRIQRFSPDGSFITEWGGVYPSDGFFTVHGPIGIAVDSDGSVYATDHKEQQGDAVQKFSADGEFILSWGGYGSNGGQFDFDGAQGIDADSAGNVYVTTEADSYGGNGDRVQKFHSNGDFVAEWGTTGGGAGQFSGPYGVATDPAGNVYVVERYNNRVQKFTAAGAFIVSWGREGTAPGQFLAPVDIDIDPAGNVYVADSGNSRIQKFTSDGAYITQWGNDALLSEPPSPPAASASARVTITFSPKARTTNRTAAFRFSSAQAGARFQCKLTGTRVPKTLRRWRPCTSPKRYKHLRPGKKVFWVRALLGRKSGKPARRAWRIANAPQRLTIPATARKAIFRARCTLARRCRAKVRISAGKRILARGRYSVPAHSNRKVAIPLTKAGRTTLRRRHRAPAKLTVVDTRTHRRSTVAVLLRRRG